MKYFKHMYVHQGDKAAEKLLDYDINQPRGRTSFLSYEISFSVKA